METTDHAVIKSWIEKRNGHPVSNGKNPPGLAIKFSGVGVNDPDEDSYREIEWELFISQFEKEQLTFITDDAPDGLDYRFGKR